MSKQSRARTTKRIKQKKASAKRQREKRKTKEIIISVNAGVDPDDGKPIANAEEEAHREIVSEKN